MKCMNRKFVSHFFSLLLPRDFRFLEPEGVLGSSLSGDESAMLGDSVQTGGFLM